MLPAHLRRISALGISLLLFTGFVFSLNMPYGLDTTEAIGPYLNGAFPSTAPEASAGLPQLLSQTGAFVNLQTMEPAAGIIPYGLEQPFWSDGAEKYRWIAVPNDGTHDTPAEQIQFSENDFWVFPAGTVAIKHFELPLDYADPSKTRRLETRFNVIAEDGSVYGFTYKWNDDETDAELLENGLTESLAVRTAPGIEIRTWEYPDREMCLTCHTPAAGRLIGPRTRQLNGDFYYSKTDRTANQVASWNHIGLFSNAVDENALPGYLTSASREAPDSTLAHQARSYLDSNCGYCHRPGGLFNAQFDARLSTPLENTGMINGFAFNNLSIPGSAIIVPGDTSKSLIYQRIKSLKLQVAMPPLAKGMVDSLGVRLVRDWILSLGEQTATDEEQVIPETTVLLDNYPNPFRAKTTIPFSLVKGDEVQLSVFDVNGVKVRTLLNQTMQPGQHSVQFNAAGLATGVYYVHLKTRQTSQTSAINLIR